MSDTEEDVERGAKASREGLDLFESIMSQFKDMMPIDEVTKAVEKVASLESECEQMEIALKAKKFALHELRSKALPAAMLKVNQSSFTVADGPYKGVTAKLTQFAAGSLPKEDTARAAAIKLLEEYKAEDMIRNVLSMEFTKYQHNIALDVKAQLEEQGFEPQMKSDVHPKTLGKLVMERLEEGLPVDPAALGIYVGKIVKLQWPKVPSAKKQASKK